MNYEIWRRRSGLITMCVSEGGKGSRKPLLLPSPSSFKSEVCCQLETVPPPQLQFLDYLHQRMSFAGSGLKNAMEESEICNFYRDKHILLTGATGFIGKLVLEKLLRLCKPKMVYLLIRTKKSSEPQKRLQEITNSKLFDRLKKEFPDFMSYVSVVSGDISAPGLDLLPSDKETIIENVQIVLHGAATVKFDEKIPLATKVNVLGTKSILELCRKMKNLQSVVYVSTAFSNCPQKHVKEEFYESPISTDNLIKLTECLKENQLDMIAPCILDKWPNTYVFTKAVAEDTVKTYGKGLPLAVFRPAIIIGTKSEPVPGWSDNLYGPQGLSLGAGIGVIRVVKCDTSCKADLVPADMAVNCLLAIGYKTSQSGSKEDIKLYNFCTLPENSLTWGDYMRICHKRAMEVPLSKGLWYCSSTCLTNWFAYFIMTFLLHTLPALAVDIVFVLMNKKPRALNIYKKIHKVVDLLSFFSSSAWDFSMGNTLDLWENISPTDKKLFDFDMRTLDFPSYLANFVDGIRLYMAQEDETTISYGRRKNLMLYCAHRLVQFVFFSSILWSLWRATNSVLAL